MTDKQRFKNQFFQCGFVSGVDLFDAGTVKQHRSTMESSESVVGPLHYKNKIHTILRSPYELATDDNVLDLVEALIGPNLMVYNVTYIVKEPHSSSHVSWHQDLTYWGFDCDDLVSMWLALSPATEQSGCMRMIPASHLAGRQQHVLTDDQSNVLYSGQTVFGVPENESVMCPLNPGQASFHHGWTLHASMPNHSDGRRIGLNVQYIATHVKQTKHDGDTAMLVRGVDEYRNFGINHPPEYDMEPGALARHEALEQRYYEIAKAKEL